jgi:hypothetical protein
MAKQASKFVQRWINRLSVSIFPANLSICCACAEAILTRYQTVLHMLSIGSNKNAYKHVPTIVPAKATRVSTASDSGIIKSVSVYTRHILRR